MIHWLWIIPAMMFGGFMGVVVMSLCVVGSRSDKKTMLRTDDKGVI